MAKESKPKLRLACCPHCGNKTFELAHKLSKGLINSLIKVKIHILQSNQNKVHPIKDLKLKNFEYNNFQKLRYFGFIAHYKDKNTQKYIQGEWILTKNGNRFLMGLLASPIQIRTMNNVISGKSKQRIMISDALASEDIPYWDDYKTPTEKRVKIEYPNISEIKQEEVIIDDNGQTKFYF
jgi:hypothetical protein